MLCMSVVYLILSHKAPTQILRLVRTIRRGSPQAHIVLSHDYCASYLDPAMFHGISRFRLVPSRTPISWGTWSQVDRQLRAMEWIANHLTFDWLIPLSAQDYPIRPLAEIEEELARAPYEVFIDKPLHLRRGHSSSYGPDLEDDYRLWFFYRHYPLPSLQLPRAVRRLAARLMTGWRWVRPSSRLPVWYVRRMPRGTPNHVGLRARRTPFDGGVQCLKGADWFTASARAVTRLLDAWREDRALVEHYRRTMSPGESFFHTVLLNPPELPACLDNRRYWVWENLPHPNVLQVKDLDQMLSSGQHFARKFDVDIDSTVLDELDRHL
jgi:hypothetical protein